MVQFVAFEVKIQVNGITIMSFVNGLGGFKELALQYLSACGLENVIASADQWYSQQKWLGAFRLIGAKIGESSLYLIGQKIPENAIFPSDMHSIEEALKSIDIAYHINHKNKEGQILFDQNRDPPMVDGIGHYEFVKIEGENKIVMKCENPYPCDFDRGIITAIATRFVSNAIVLHDDSKECRKSGDNSCTYNITW